MLQGRNLKSGEVFQAYVSELPCTLGREHVNKPKKGFVSLGHSKTISRCHAIIGYDKEQKFYYLESKGRNFVTVRKVQHGIGDTYYSKPDGPNSFCVEPVGKRIKINSKDPIRIGDIGFYFLKSIK